MSKFYIIKNIDKIILNAIVELDLNTTEVFVHDFKAKSITKLYTKEDAKVYAVSLNSGYFDFSLLFMAKKENLIDSTWRLSYDYEKSKLYFPGAEKSTNHMVLAEFDDLDSARLYFEMNID